MRNMTRGRGWRRRQRAKHARRQETRDLRGRPGEERREKKWRLLYTRSVKLHRAAQLGMTYPRPSDEWSGHPLVH